MLELLNDTINIQCNKCREIINILSNELEPDISWYDHGENGMGTESMYEISHEVECPTCGCEIKFTITGWEYPQGALDNSRTEISGGQFVDEPMLGIICNPGDFGADDDAITARQNFAIAKDQAKRLAEEGGLIMTKRISENDLFLPALYVIYLHKRVNTTQIKDTLVAVFQPTGEDNERLAGRPDTKFTQKVRNLMGSHYTTNGMALCTSKDAGGYFTLTAQGMKAVEDNEEFLSYLFDNSFKYEQTKGLATKIHTARVMQRKLYVYDENDVVLEGKASTKTAKVKERSKKLREAAIQYYTVDGRIKCCVCGFDFSEKYGEHGIGYIQIHHENPICQYADEGFEAYIQQAVLDTKPLCANCHCMIHRSKTHILSIEELKAIIDKGP